MDTTFVDMLICETFIIHQWSLLRPASPLYWTKISICLIILPIGFYEGSSGYCKNLSIKTLITDNVSCLLSHPNSFGSISVLFEETVFSIICTPLTDFLSYVLTGFKGEQTSSVRFIERWPFSVLNGSLLS